MKIGLGQLLVEGGEPERNFERAIELIEEAKEQSCDLILLPETLDLAWTHPSALNEAEPIPGKFSNILTEAAIKNDIYICAGLTEKRKDGVYNSAILINNKGEIISNYSKINVLDVGLEFYKVGTTLNVVDTPFGKIGINICADNYSDGLAIGHTLARMGAQIILSPSSWTVDYSVNEENNPYEEKWVKPYSSLAQLFDIAILGVTSVGYIVGGPYEGKKMVGCSLAVNKQGIIAQGEFNEFAGDLIICEFETPTNQPKGTDISKSLENQGFNFNDFAKYEK
jgi:predicted amidohydrolase